MFMINRERCTEFYDPFCSFDDLEFNHFGRTIEGDFCMIEPDKVVLDIFPDGHMEFSL